MGNKNYLIDFTIKTDLDRKFIEAKDDYDVINVAQKLLQRAVNVTIYRLEELPIIVTLEKRINDPDESL